MTVADLEAFDPDVARIGSCPYPTFARLREERPVHRIPGQDVYLVSRYADCLAVVRDVETFVNDHDLLIEHHGRAMGWVPPDDLVDVADIYASALPNIETLHFLDPPLHTVQRRRINRWFTSKRAETSWRPLVEELTHQLIDRFAPDGRVELMSQFAVPLPIRAIATILGVPTDREAEFKVWSDAFVSGMGLPLDHDGWRVKAQSRVDMQQFFLAEIEARRAEPRDDLLGELVAAASDAEWDGPEEERPFTVLEILNAVQHLLAAGNETTTQAIGLMVKLLVEHPDQLERVRQDPDLVANTVEEALRVEAPVLGMWRYCTTDADVGGTVVPAGALVVLLFGAANHDGAAFSCPADFQVDRPDASRHLSLGHGIHFCVGAGLARMELQVALRALLDRLPGLRLEPGVELEHGESWMMRNLHALPLRFDPT